MTNSMTIEKQVESLKGLESLLKKLIRLNPHMDMSDAEKSILRNRACDMVQEADFEATSTSIGSIPPAIATQQEKEASEKIERIERLLRVIQKAYRG